MAIKKIMTECGEELMEILNCVQVGIYITDGKGKTLALNNESEKSGGLTKEEVVGKYMTELVAMGFVKESATLRAMKSGKRESFVQDLGDGEKIFITAEPFFRGDKLEFVVCTERDVTEAESLKALLYAKDQEREKYETEIEYLRKKINFPSDVIAESQNMKLVLEMAMKISKLDTTVLLTGESGTGKEVLANLIHRNSERRDASFIPVNCAAIPENLIESEFFGYEAGAFTGADKGGKIGLFELADKGTIFLDEIGELPIHMQSKLLRALQEKKIMRIGGKKNIDVDFRVIAATNMDLKHAIMEGNFREDLYYRLNVIPIEIPPLRRRKEDITPLAEHFIQIFSKQYKINKKLNIEVNKILKNYHWPGNVRELKNLIERVMVSFDGVEITKFQVLRLLYYDEGFPEREGGEEKTTFQQLVDEYEKELLMKAMERYGKAAEVSKHLSINKSTLSHKLKKHKIACDWK